MSEGQTPTIRLTAIVTEEQQGVIQALVARTGTEAGLDPYASGDTHYWLIEVLTGPGQWSVAGYTGIHTVNWVSRRCRGILWIMPEARRKGIGEEALRQRNLMLFDQLNMNRVEWVIPMSNEARIAMADKMGQYREGVMREVVYYDGRYHDYALYSMIRSEVK